MRASRSFGRSMMLRGGLPLCVSLSSSDISDTLTSELSDRAGCGIADAGLLLSSLAWTLTSTAGPGASSLAASSQHL